MESYAEEDVYENFDLLNITNTMENHDPAHHEHEQFYMMCQFITGLILYPIICFPGLIGNILTLVVLSKPNMRNSTNAFLSALAVSDSIKMLNDILYFSVILMLKTDPETANKLFGYIYPYAHFIFNMSGCVSAWLTVSVAVERYILVCHAPKARTMCNRSRAILTSSLVFVVMTGVALPSLWRYRTITVLDTDTNRTVFDIKLTDLWEKKDKLTMYYTWAMNFFRCNIPCVVLVIMNTCIITALWKTRANKRSNSRQKITFMMIIVILVFTICITPDAIMSTFLGFGYGEEDYLVKGIREFTDTLLALNAAVNFVIYCVFSHKFRQNFNETFCGRRPYKRQTKDKDDPFYRRLSDQSSVWSHFKRNSFV